MARITALLGVLLLFGIAAMPNQAQPPAPQAPQDRQQQILDELTALRQMIDRDIGGVKQRVQKLEGEINKIPELIRKVEELERQLNRPSPPVPTNGGGPDNGHAAPPPKPVTAAKKLSGKSSYRPDTGELTVFYDFATAGQLNDFEAEGAPVLERGRLKLEPGSLARHVVPFQTVTVTGRIQAAHAIGPMVRAGRVTVHLNKHEGGHYPETWLLYGKNERVLSPEYPSGNMWELDLKILSNRISLKLGEKTLGKVIDQRPAGRVEFVGGDGAEPVYFSHVNLSGRVDPQWAKENLMP